MEPKICTNCGETFFKHAKPAKNYFCCRKCYHDWKKGPNNPNWRGGPAVFICSWCKKEFSITRDRITSQDGKYCGSDCYKMFLSSVKMPEKQKRLAKKSLNNLVRWLRKETETKLNWLEIFGYSPQEFADHISSQFKEGMHWGNYGKWTIDHIKPTQFFEFENEHDEGFKRCFSLKNLQPLWREENTLKGRKYKGRYFPRRRNE